jgi:predicted nucleotidyltransferase
MSVIDGRVGVPSLDAASLGRLAVALDQEGVVAAMLIGSETRGAARPLADIDVAVWCQPGLYPSQLLSLQLGLASAASQALGAEAIGVVILNQAPAPLRHRAIQEAVRLVDRDPKSRLRLETRALVEYLDTQAPREKAPRGLRKRMREGWFGSQGN